MSARKRLLNTVVVNDSTGSEFDIERLRDLLDFCYRSRRKKIAALDLLVADDAEMTKLNRCYLKQDNPTDVLAFDDGEMEDGHIRLGDIAINIEIAKRTAAKRGGDFEPELAFYALHGLLHLLGMRDDDDSGRTEMLAEQVRIMREFGWEVGDDLC
ncbi:MAG: rRNA maturation RNase YbeY [Planctomycetes bacterium]|nr:rRNA maturation RNase YbeY [Planctomycetota bacterium]